MRSLLYLPLRAAPAPSGSGPRRSPASRHHPRRQPPLPHSSAAYPTFARPTRSGAEKLDDVLEWCAEVGIPAVSLWVFSTNNFRRPATEISGILSAVESKLTALARQPKFHRLGLRIRAVGKLDLLPDSTIAAIRAAEGATAGNRKMVLTFAVACGAARRSSTR